MKIKNKKAILLFLLYFCCTGAKVWVPVSNWLTVKVLSWRYIGKHLICSPDVLKQKRRQRECLNAALEFIYFEQLADRRARQLQKRNRFLKELIEQKANAGDLLPIGRGAREKALENKPSASSIEPEREKLANYRNDSRRRRSSKLRLKGYPGRALQCSSSWERTLSRIAL